MNLKQHEIHIITKLIMTNTHYLYAQFSIMLDLFFHLLHWEWFDECILLSFIELTFKGVTEDDLRAGAPL